jgi:hypothetical protein
VLQGLSHGTTPAAPVLYLGHVLVEFAYPIRPSMTDLLLKRGGRRGEESYDVIADGIVVGRIMMFADTPAGRPWIWSVAYGHDEGRTPTHGYEATREAAMQAFARRWNCE